MLTNMTRSRLIQSWFAAVALAIVTGVAFDAAVTAGTLSMLLALTLIPPTIVLLMWPGTQPLTAAEVLYDRDRGAQLLSLPVAESRVANESVLRP